MAVISKKLLNIHNNRREIYLFERDENGILKVNKDNTFYPYYYELDENGPFETYDFKKVKKVICSEPKEVKERRSENSYEADILYPKRYILDNITYFEKTAIKYLFIDIEILAKDLPNVKEPKDKISCRI